jgi:hypothetical protein
MTARTRKRHAVSYTAFDEQMDLHPNERLVLEALLPLSFSI